MSSLSFDSPAPKPPKKRGRKPSSARGIDRLTKSERALLDLLIDDHAAKEAAFLRGLTNASGKMYLKNARHATGFRHTLAMAVRYALAKAETPSDTPSEIPDAGDQPQMTDMTSPSSPFKELRALAQELVDRLDLVHQDPNYQGVWQMAQLHGEPYSGPQYAVELLALRRCLDGLPRAGLRDERCGGDLRSPQVSTDPFLNGR